MSRLAWHEGELPALGSQGLEHFQAGHFGHLPVRHDLVGGVWDSADGINRC